MSETSSPPSCRYCASPLGAPVLDLGYAPPSNAYRTDADFGRPEVSYPLRIRYCPDCHLVQTDDFSRADELFDHDYAYFSSTSKGWLAHAKRYTEDMTDRFGLTGESFVIEVASNDGYLLRNFCDAGVPCLGIEPTQSTADAARSIGVPTLQEFFGAELAATLAAQGKSADLIAGNNVYAHVPDIRDFTLGLATALKPQGVITLEFPHLLQLMQHNQFDTVYHEHFSYLSLLAVQRMFDEAGLRIFDVTELPTHGGSLRVFGCLKDANHQEMPGVAKILAKEKSAKLDSIESFLSLQDKAFATKTELLSFFLDARANGKSIAAYGAAAKGNTLLNYAGVTRDLLPFVCDAAPSKQHKFMPGSHIPILPPDALEESRPDYVLILPWNIATEVKEQLRHLSEAGTRFFVAIPELAEI